MQRVDQAYVLRTQELGEADLIVTLLTEHSGRVRGVARSGRKSRKRFGGALEPLTRVQARWVERAGRELDRIEALELVRSHADLQSEPGLQATCAVLVEVAGHVAREGQPDPKGFRLIGAVLDALRAGLDPWVAIRYFEYWTLRLNGVLSALEVCGVCGRELEPGGRRAVRIDGTVLCSGCRGTGHGAVRLLDRSDLDFLARCASRPPEALGGEVPAARPGGAVEALLKGGLEAFVERPFRTYRHLAPVRRATVAKG